VYIWLSKWASEVVLLGIKKNIIGWLRDQFIQEHRTTLNVYAPNIKASKYIKIEKKK
jgi:hypothetical protein